jgi:hypothetical protein
MKVLAINYQYPDPVMGEQMVEYHVDNSKYLFERAGELYPEFGGLLSFCMKSCEKPLILFGQDEVIFKQYLLTSKARVG